MFLALRIRLRHCGKFEKSPRPLQGHESARLSPHCQIAAALRVSIDFRLFIVVDALSFVGYLFR